LEICDVTEPLWRMVQPAMAGEVASRYRYESPEAGVESYVSRDEPTELLAAAVDGACPECPTLLPRRRRVQPLSFVWPRASRTRPGTSSGPRALNCLCSRARSLVSCARDAQMAAGATDWSFDAVAWIYGHDAATPA
jgi:hypothetical protein